MWKAIQAYQKANPSAVLAQSTTPFLSFADKLNTELGGKGGPDIFVVQDVNFYPLADAGILAPLTSVISSHKGMPFNHTNKSGLVNGVQYGITWERLNWNFFWNRKILEKVGVTPPTNITELISAAGQIRSATGLDGFGVRHQMTEFDSWFMDFDVWTYGFGGSWSDGSLAHDQHAEQYGVEAFGELYRSGAMPIGDDASTMRTKFREGRLGMMIDVSTAGILRSSSPDIGRHRLCRTHPAPGPRRTRRSCWQSTVMARTRISRSTSLAGLALMKAKTPSGRPWARQHWPLTSRCLPITPRPIRGPRRSSTLHQSRSPLIRGYEAQTKATCGKS